MATPSTTLPPDILRHVFGLYQGTLKERLILGLVCRSWHESIEATQFDYCFSPPLRSRASQGPELQVQGAFKLANLKKIAKSYRARRLLNFTTAGEAIPWSQIYRISLTMHGHPTDLGDDQEAQALSGFLLSVFKAMSACKALESLTLRNVASMFIHPEYLASLQSTSIKKLHFDDVFYWDGAYTDPLEGYRELFRSTKNINFSMIYQHYTSTRISQLLDLVKDSVESFSISLDEIDDEEGEEIEAPQVPRTTIKAGQLRELSILVSTNAEYTREVPFDFVIHAPITTFTTDLEAYTCLTFSLPLIFTSNLKELRLLGGFAADVDPRFVQHLSSLSGLVKLVIDVEDECKEMWIQQYSGSQRDIDFFEGKDFIFEVASQINTTGLQQIEIVTAEVFRQEKIRKFFRTLQASASVTSASPFQLQMVIVRGHKLNKESFAWLREFTAELQVISEPTWIKTSA